MKSSFILSSSRTVSIFYSSHSMRMDVRVISLKNPSALLNQTKRMFPNANVAIQRGVDARGTSVDHLHKVGLVTEGMESAVGS